jgi:D-alanine-D-alanine ligase
MKILVLHNGSLESEGAQETDSAHLRDLADALESHGFEVSVVDAENDASRISHAVVVEQPRLIFNLVHQWRGDTLLNPNVASLLELHGLPHTGSDPLCLSTCQDRVRTHLLLSDAGVPVPGYVVVRDLNAIPDTAHLEPPLAVSHAWDDIYDEPGLRVTVHSREELEESARELAAGAELPLLVERFIAGRRIQAVVLGNRALEVLPLTERPLADSAGTLGPARVAQLDPDSADLVRSLAQRAFRVMDCRDCAQIDFALDDEGAPHIIYVRPAFDTFPGSPFAVGARASELGLGGVLALMAEAALERAPQPPESRPESPPPPREPPSEPEPDEEEEEAASEAEADEEEAAGPKRGAPLERRARLQSPPRRPASRGRPRIRLATEPGAAPPAEPPPPMSETQTKPAASKKTGGKKKTAAKKKARAKKIGATGAKRAASKRSPGKKGAGKKRPPPR